MITLLDDYVVVVDPLNYTLMADYGKKDKNGRPIRKTIGHYSSLAKAVQACIDENVRSGFYDRCVGLEEAVRIMNERMNKSDELLKRCLPDSFTAHTIGYCNETDTFWFPFEFCSRGEIYEEECGEDTMP